MALFHVDGERRSERRESEETDRMKDEDGEDRMKKFRKSILKG